MCIDLDLKAINCPKSAETQQHGIESAKKNHHGHELSRCGKHVVIPSVYPAQEHSNVQLKNAFTVEDLLLSDAEVSMSMSICCMILARG